MKEIVESYPENVQCPFCKRWYGLFLRTVEITDWTGQSHVMTRQFKCKACKQIWTKGKL
jgi:hypothetical protein